MQSVALKLITEREHEIESFKPEEYWSLIVNFQDEKDNLINSKINVFKNNKIERFSFRDKSSINNATDLIKTKNYLIKNVSNKVFKRNPVAPFTTSTLQQSASGKYGFGASRTMQIAQRLYQGIDIDGDTVGLITLYENRW